jgi:hypothetical protein
MLSAKTTLIVIISLFLWGGFWVPVEEENIAFDIEIAQQDSATSFLSVGRDSMPKTFSKPHPHHHSGTLLTRQLQEVYLLADFLFHSIGFEFLGGQTQPVTDPLYILRQSIHDSCTLQCEERSELMLEICQRSFGISGQLVNIPGHHSFPVFTIGKKEYIIDPYDPIYFLSPKDHHVLSWGELQEKTEYILVRTARKYGPSKELISKNLSAKWGIDNQPINQATIKLETSVSRTLNQIKKSRNIEIPMHQERKLSPSQSQTYPWKLELWDRQDGDNHIPESYGLPPSKTPVKIYIEQ